MGVPNPIANQPAPGALVSAFGAVTCFTCVANAATVGVAFIVSPVAVIVDAIANFIGYGAALATGIENRFIH
jgi:hypothetical protein